MTLKKLILLLNDVIAFMISKHFKVSATLSWDLTKQVIPLDTNSSAIYWQQHSN